MRKHERSSRMLWALFRPDYAMTDTTAARTEQRRAKQRNHEDANPVSVQFSSVSSSVQSVQAVKRESDRLISVFLCRGRIIRGYMRRKDVNIA